MSGIKWIGNIFAAVAIVFAGHASPVPTKQKYDVVIRNGTVVDGTGRPGFVADVAIQNDKIVSIGTVTGDGTVTIEAKGLVVAPGFIDMLSHSEYSLLVDGHGPSFSLQGVTLQVFGEGESMGPVGGKRTPPDLPPGVKLTWNTLGEFLDTLERRGTASNFCSYVGSGGVRATVVGYENRPATPVEIEEEKKIVREAMAEGAMGLSSALSYVPNIYMSTEELTALAKEAAAVGGIYASHIRSVNGRNPEAVREAIAIGEGAGLPVHLFHLNSVASTSADKFLAIIREARQRGVKVTADAYPYTWGITGLSDYLPVWAQAGGLEAMLARLRDPEQRRRIAKGFRTEEPFYLTSWDRVRLGVSDPAINGKLVSEVAEIRHKDADDVYMDIILEQRGRGIVIDKNNEESALREVVLEPYVSVGTDGSAVDISEMDKQRDNDLVSPLLHPRHLGTFPRWFAKYVREEHLMTLEEAIRRMTSLAAETLGLNDRGVLAPDKFADVVVFDPNTITDKATYEDPNHYSEGIRYLLVNGKIVVQDGKVTSALPGRALRRTGYQKDHLYSHN
jgi:N-acyl-D-aspartate/D-glutamate deacylase